MGQEIENIIATRKKPIYEPGNLSFDPIKFLKLLAKQRDTIAIYLNVLKTSKGAMELPLGPRLLIALGVCSDGIEELSIVSRLVMNFRIFERALEALDQCFVKERRFWPEAIPIAEDAARLIPLLFNPSQTKGVQHRTAMDCFSYSSRLASLVLAGGGSAFRALGVLMDGRGVIADALIRNRLPMDDVRRADAGLADEFQALQEQLDTVRTNHGLLTEVEILRKKLDDVIIKINAINGLDTFRRPDEEKVKEAATEGTIVVINVSTRCDAIIIRPTGITSIELVELKQVDIEKYVDCFQNPLAEDKRTKLLNMSAALEWLWKVLADPILTHLGHTAPPSGTAVWPRIWWIGTGKLASFPIHAAGLQATHQNAAFAPNSVLDRVVSSYSPSVKALIYSREIVKTRGVVNPPSRKPVLLWTSGDDLASCKSEVMVIEAELAKFTPRPAIIKMEISTTRNTTGYLRDCSIFHFSGHGVSIPNDPTKSYLKLAKRKFSTISDLLSVELKPNQASLANGDGMTISNLLDLELQSSPPTSTTSHPLTVSDLLGIKSSLNQKPLATSSVVTLSKLLGIQPHLNLPKLTEHDILTVSDILDLNLHLNRPFLATLSACHTGNLEHRSLGDEGIHLMRAFQLAGFSHVTGSLWATYDNYAVEIYREVYRSIVALQFSDASVSWSVHNGVRILRDMAREVPNGVSAFGGDGHPFLWAAFIHVGI